ncbi:zinc carboxypeptidase [Candidatus Fermentibacterales bacterium]|nr:zinc carboxypeptidase [Candidatus Fermentibacterales bacterium]
MKRWVVPVIVFVLTATSWSGRIVRLYDLSQEQVLALLESGYDITSSDARLGFADVMLERGQLDQAALLAPRYEVMPEEWAHLMPESSRAMGYYYDPQENWAFWCGLAAAYPDLADTPASIGQSFEGRDIYVIRLTSTVGADWKPPILFTSLTHAREPGGNSVLIDFAMWLTDNYSSDTMAEWILDNTEVCFVPIVNPDGYEYNMPNGGNQRKNMNFSVPVPSSGIDLNRNYGYMWGYDDYGSSPNPYSETYRGSAAFSEDESQVMRDFTDALDPIASMNYHTYGGHLLFPWAYNNTPTPDQSTFESWGAAMTQYNGYNYGRCGQCLGYNANGDAVDWSYWSGGGHPKMWSFTPEVDDAGFWGGQNDTTLIASFCAECRYMNIWLCMNAPGFVGVEEEESHGIEPSGLSIGSLWPNPVVGTGCFSLSLSSPAGSRVALSLYDLTGRLVADLLDSGVEAGWSVLHAGVPDRVVPGLYVLRASSGQLEDRTLLTVLR